MLDWLIVGGGIHGTHLAILLRASGTKPSRLRILDPHENLLARWEERAGRTGMMVLRSPGVHHLAPGPHDLFRFARHVRRPPGGAPPFRGKTRRPSLALFQAHARALVGEWGLECLHLRGALMGLRRVEGGWEVETGEGALRARRVVLAMGSADPSLPSWVPASLATCGAVCHLFDPRHSPLRAAEVAHCRGQTVGVVGGGISAVQFALRLARAGIATRLIVRHPWRIHRYDTDPGWLGPLRLAAFGREADPEARKAMIRGARNRGSIPEEEWRRVRALAHGESLAVIRGEPQALHPTEEAPPEEGIGSGVAAPGRFDLVLADPDAPPHPLGALVLATGLQDLPLPATTWKALVEALALPTLSDGTPLPAPDLAWGPGLHVMGRLAELQLGPVAGNVAGARMAAQRLVHLGPGTEGRVFTPSSALQHPGRRVGVAPPPPG